MEELADRNKDDLFSAYIMNDEELQTPIFIPPRRIKNFDKQDFLNSVYEVVQSNSRFLLSGVLRLKLTITNALSGSGRALQPPSTRDEQQKNDRSTITINNKDKSCAFHALVLAIHHAEEFHKKNKKEWDKLRQDRGKRLAKEAKTLCRNYNL